MIQNLSKFRRLITFGCSLTNYKWPMWPHLLIKDMPEAKLLNFGHAGAGNLQISCLVSQVHKNVQFCETDLVIVMWSSFVREDRYVNGKWQAYGNVYNNHYYDYDFCKKYVDPVGFLKRDCELMYLTGTMLESLPCTTVILKSHPFLANEVIDNEQQLREMDNHNIMPYILETYSDMFNSMPKSLCEVVYDNYPKTNKFCSYGHKYVTNHKLFEDAHPKPMHSLRYLNYLGFNLSQRVSQHALETTDLLGKCLKEEDIYDTFKNECHTMIENQFVFKNYETISRPLV